MTFEPSPEHALLRKFVGEWTFEGDCDMGPGQPRMKHTGTESGRMLGDAWVLVSGTGLGEGLSTPHLSQLTIGFDPKKQQFVGTFIASMMTHLWIYEGVLAADGKTLPLECDGPNMVDPTKFARYRDTHEFVDDDHRVLHAWIRGDDGAWTEFMTVRYERVS